MLLTSHIQHYHTLAPKLCLHEPCNMAIISPLGLAKLTNIRYSRNLLDQSVQSCPYVITLIAIQMGQLNYGPRIFIKNGIEDPWNLGSYTFVQASCPSEFRCIIACAKSYGRMRASISTVERGNAGVRVVPRGFYVTNYEFIALKSSQIIVLIQSCKRTIKESMRTIARRHIIGQKPRVLNSAQHQFKFNQTLNAINSTVAILKF